MIVRQPVCDAVGLIHAASVIAEVTELSDVDEGTCTMLATPSKFSPPPYLPATQVAPVIVPVLPFPEASTTDVPEPASKVYAATRPDGGGGAVPVVPEATLEKPLTLPAASTAETRYEYDVDAARPASTYPTVAGAATWANVVQSAPEQRSTR